jgi:hypothetical protein
LVAPHRCCSYGRPCDAPECAHPRAAIRAEAGRGRRGTSGTTFGARSIAAGSGGGRCGRTAAARQT